MFAVADCILIRWADGYCCVPAEAGGKERYLEIRGIVTRDDAVKLGQELLDAYKTQRTSTAVTGHVWNSSQQPGTGFYLGDKLDGELVQSITIDIDGDGATVVTPELGDALAVRLEALNRKLARMATPVQSEWASPTPRPRTSRQVDTTVPSFTFRGQSGGGGGS